MFSVTILINYFLYQNLIDVLTGWLEFHKNTLHAHKEEEVQKLKQSQDRAKAQYEETQRIAEETQRIADERAAAAAAAEKQKVDATRQRVERENMGAEDKIVQVKRKLSMEEQDVAKASWSKVQN